MHMYNYKNIYFSNFICENSATNCLLCTYIIISVSYIPNPCHNVYAKQILCKHKRLCATQRLHLSIHTLGSMHTKPESPIFLCTIDLHLGANFGSRVEVVPPGVNFTPGGEFYPWGRTLSPGVGVKIIPWGEILCSPLHSSK
jgi:hypothetical protein